MKFDSLEEFRDTVHKGLDIYNSPEAIALRTITVTVPETGDYVLKSADQVNLKLSYNSQKPYNRGVELYWKNINRQRVLGVFNLKAGENEVLLQHPELSKNVIAELISIRLSN